MSRFRVKQRQVQAEEQSSKVGSDYDYMEMPLPNDMADNHTFKNKKVSDNTNLQQPISKKKLIELMKERRLEALETPVPSNSKGALLLSKFGYNGKCGLGRNEQGLTAPIVPLQREFNRAGLGAESLSGSQVPISKRLRASLEESKYKTMSYDFRITSSKQYSERHIHKLITQSENTIQNLDERQGINRHMLWPKDVAGKENGDDADFPIGSIDYERLGKYNKEDVDSESDDDNSNKDAGDYTEKYKRVFEEEVLLEVKLKERLQYLRSQHHYCLFCGCAYVTLDELEMLCPGELEDDH